MPVQKLTLSGSVGGKPIQLGVGTTIHQCVSGTLNTDEVFIWLINRAAGTVQVEVATGNAPEDTVVHVYSVAPNSVPTPALVGQIFNNSVKIIGGTYAFPNIITAIGYVIRTTI